MVTSSSLFSSEDLECTKMYSCVNEGCPNAGASQMKCKPGFYGPLCAICEEDHYEQLGRCVRCEQPRFVAILLFLMSGLVGLALLRFLYKYRHVVIAMQVGANLKILVSFITVVSTVNTQFGVTWPVSVGVCEKGVGLERMRWAAWVRACLMRRGSAG